MLIVFLFIFPFFTIWLFLLLLSEMVTSLVRLDFDRTLNRKKGHKCQVIKILTCKSNFPLLKSMHFGKYYAKEDHLPTGWDKIVICCVPKGHFGVDWQNFTKSRKNRKSAFWSNVNSFWMQKGFKACHALLGLLILDGPSCTFNPFVIKS